MGFTSYWTIPCALISILAARWLSGGLRSWVLLAASVLFYAALDANALAPLGLVVLFSWVTGHLLCRRKSRSLFAITIALTLSPLLVAKYLPWMLECLATGDWWRSADLASRGVPPGLSFVALQATGFLFDVWRGHVYPTNLRDHALFLAFFPQLVAGPIERADRLMPQLKSPPSPPSSDMYRAAKLLLFGYALKLCIADALAGPIDRWLRLPGADAPAGLVLALPLFSARLYLDFYAYSCIAVAFGMAHGVELTQNFRHPYSASSLTEFWQRWHISLSSWWRDYVYKPLGGRSAGAVRATTAVLIVFILSGAWHGAGLGFLLWGAVHGVGLLAERLGRSALSGFAVSLPAMPRRVLRGLCVATTLTFVSLCWLPFLAAPEQPFPFLVKRLLMALTDASMTAAAASQLLAADWLIVSAAVVVAIGAHRMESWYWRRAPTTSRLVASDLAITNTLVIVLLLFGDFGGRTFIYFAF